LKSRAESPIIGAGTQMLTLLRIRNLALVEALEWEPGPGFVAVTGETGAGKSIILGALKLLLGERADRGLIRAWADQCSVEATFRVPAALDLNPWLVEQGVEPCADGVLILRRAIAVEGPSRQFINGSPATLNALRWVGDALVDLHGPHDHQSLLVTERQLDCLDAFAGCAPERRAHAEALRRVRDLEAQRAELGADADSVAREIDLARYQVSEIRSLDLKPEHEADLLARYARAGAGRRLAEIATRALAALEESEGAALDRLAEAQRLLNELAGIDPEAGGPLAASHRGALVELEDVASSLRRYADGLELDPGALAELERQVNLLETLKKKYGGTLAEALAFAHRTSQRIERLERRCEELERIEAELDTARAALDRAGAALSRKRAEAAPRLALEVSRHLKDLGFARSEFRVELGRASEPRASGTDLVEFVFAPNPGEPARALRQVASSGEISRVMLALKTALVQEDSIALMVFDEIDANVGGAIAHAVAAKMRALSRRHQLLVITHLPQVAAAARRQFLVTKEFAGDRTRSLLHEVAGDRRVEEIARMLGGGGASARAHALTLLGGSIDDG